MGCKHKFYSDLNLGRIDYQPGTLVIGTFNPEFPIVNYADWFYGRTSNNYFWDALPRLFGEQSLRKDAGVSDWKSFCERNKVAITDLIASIEDADEQNPIHFEVISKYKDQEFAQTFNEFEFTEIVQILKDNPTIKQVYFTRQPGVDLFDEQIEVIKNYCGSRNIYFANLLTPSANARFQMRGYKPKDPKLERSLANFIYEKWLENWI